MADFGVALDHHHNGKSVTLDTLCSREPAWAANQIRLLRVQVEKLDRFRGLADRAGFQVHQVEHPEDGIVIIKDRRISEVIEAIIMNLEAENHKLEVKRDTLLKVVKREQRTVQDLEMSRSAMAVEVREAAVREAGLHQRLRDALHPDQKNYFPGTRNGGYSTPWNRTVQRAVDYVKAHPGCTIGEVVKGMDHHYASDKSARACTRVWLPERAGIRAKRDGRVLRYYFGEECRDERS